MTVSKSGFNLLLATTLTLSGCAGFAVNRSSVPLSDQNHTVVAQDFVNALSGLRGHSPTNTMLQVRPSNAGFGKSLLRELRDVGYGLQTIAQDDTGPMLVTYQADTFENSTYQSVAYRVRIGDVELGREYEIRAGRIFPISSLSVKGVEIASRALDQSLFERIDDDRLAESAVRDLPNDRASIVPVTTRAVPVQQPEVSTPSQLSGPADTTNHPNDRHPRPVTTQNLLILGESNYEDVFSQYPVVTQDVIVFPNDSMNLGRHGKQQVKRLLKDFNSQTDLISVVGCSHGKTRVENGNKALALGRAQRVVDELLAYRVAQDRLFDEGCWAAVVQKTLPSRGVIISLRRHQTAT